MGRIVEYFTVEAKHIKINNIKHEFRIMYQQSTCGHHYPPQVNQQTLRHKQETQRSNKKLDQAINYLHSYLKEPPSSKALFSYKILQSSSNADPNQPTYLPPAILSFFPFFLFYLSHPLFLPSLARHSSALLFTRQQAWCL